MSTDHSSTEQGSNDAHENANANDNHHSGSVIASRGAFSPAQLGASRPARPAQMDPAVVDHLESGVDPQEVNEMAHVSATALLHRVHQTQNPQIVHRVLTLVDTEGVDIIASLWSHCEPESLPGILWRLYLLRTWMHRNKASISLLWQLGEPEATSASAIAGVDQTPNEADIARIADSILSGAFTGDFAVALERAYAFTDVIAHGLHVRAQQLIREAKLNGTAEDGRTPAAKLLHTSGNLMTTSQDFMHGANLWRRGKLE